MWRIDGALPRHLPFAPSPCSRAMSVWNGLPDSFDFRWLPCCDHSARVDASSRRCPHTRRDPPLCESRTEWHPVRTRQGWRIVQHSRHHAVFGNDRCDFSRRKDHFCAGLAGIVAFRRNDGRCSTYAQNKAAPLDTFRLDANPANLRLACVVISAAALV
jgi:hypothetical protein